MIIPIKIPFDKLRDPVLISQGPPVNIILNFAYCWNRIYIEKKEIFYA